MKKINILSWALLICLTITLNIKTSEHEQKTQSELSFDTKEFIKLIKTGKVEIVKKLIENKEINFNKNEDELAINIAIDKGFTEIVILLIQNGVDINAKDKKGQTALHFASKKGLVQIVQLLLEGGADINATTEYGNTALTIATHFNCSEIVKLLLINGATISDKRNEVRTILNFAKKHPELIKVFRNYHFEMCQKITDSGLIPDLANLATLYITDWSKQKKIDME